MLSEYSNHPEESVSLMLDRQFHSFCVAVARVMLRCDRRHVWPRRWGAWLALCCHRFTGFAIWGFFQCCHLLSQEEMSMLVKRRIRFDPKSPMKEMRVTYASDPSQGRRTADEFYNVEQNTSSAASCYKLVLLPCKMASPNLHQTVFFQDFSYFGWYI